MEKGRVIIVEDEENILSMLGEFLMANRYAVDPTIDMKALSA